MTEAELLHRFTTADERLAKQAFDRLVELSRDDLVNYLKRFNTLNVDDRNDIVQDVYARIWKIRLDFQNKGELSWKKYLKITAERCAFDQLRKSKNFFSVTESEMDQFDVPSAERPIVSNILDLILQADDLDQLFECANICWLGVDPTLSTEIHMRQLLAAQLFYLDGEPWKQVIRLLGKGPIGEPPLTRDLLDSWLSDDGVLRLLAFNTLFFDNDRLVGRILGLPEPVDSNLLDDYARYASSNDPSRHTAPKGWTWDEVAVVIWRFRHGIPKDSIPSRKDLKLNPVELAELTDRLDLALPFSKEMATFLSAMQQGGAPLDSLKKTGLWRRMVFEYRYFQGLQHNDILQRVLPASKMVGVEITSGQLNVWLSNYRLIKELEKTWKKHYDV